MRNHAFARWGSMRLIHVRTPRSKTPEARILGRTIRRLPFAWGESHKDKNQQGLNPQICKPLELQCSGVARRNASPRDRGSTTTAHPRRHHASIAPVTPRPSFIYTEFSPGRRLAQPGPTHGALIISSCRDLALFNKSLIT